MAVITPSYVGTGTIGTTNIANGAVTEPKLASDINISVFVNDAGYITLAEVPEAGVDANVVAEISAITTLNLLELSANGGNAVTTQYALTTLGNATTTDFSGTLDGGNA